ncbi:hypothetical protein [Paracoccus litorisediminis]|uniref:Uncharacterized protein n=1 Tax=Paracoccus litorisediminis TaxID=2006130 RepID=A0A844HV17_9RHOB|nr:hypothetical protein [Paracoccus litorisediminis]MTH62187.1 hypothetical protein [Paracoccus litorisediminis]
MSVPENLLRRQLPKPAYRERAGEHISYHSVLQKQNEQLQQQVNDLTEAVNWLLNEARKRDVTQARWIR